MSEDYPRVVERARGTAHPGVLSTRERMASVDLAPEGGHKIMSPLEIKVASGAGEVLVKDSAKLVLKEEAREMAGQAF